MNAARKFSGYEFEHTVTVTLRLVIHTAEPSFDVTRDAVVDGLSTRDLPGVVDNMGRVLVAWSVTA